MIQIASGEKQVLRCAQDDTLSERTNKVSHLRAFASSHIRAAKVQ